MVTITLGFVLGEAGLALVRGPLGAASNMANTVLAKHSMGEEHSLLRLQITPRLSGRLFSTRRLLMAWGRLALARPAGQVSLLYHRSRASLTCQVQQVKTAPRYARVTMSPVRM